MPARLRTVSLLVLLVFLGATPSAEAARQFTDLGGFDLPTRTSHVAISGSFAVTNSESGIEIWDLSVPETPLRVGLAPLPEAGEPEDGRVAASGSFAFLADPGSGLRVFDFTDPAAPQQVENLATPGEPRDVEVVGDVAYLADGTGGVRIFDVSDPSAPVEIGARALPTPGFAEVDARFVAFDGGRLYVTGTARRIGVVEPGVILWILDVSNPAAPTQLAIDDTLLCEAWDPAVAQGVLYVGDSAGCPFDPFAVLRVIDVSDPANPVPATPLSLEASVTDVVASGDHAFASTGLFDGGFQVLDLSAPLAPVPGASIGTGGPGITVAGGLAVTNHGSGIEVVDVGEPAGPVSLAVVDPLDDTVAVRVVGSLAYLSLAGPGLRILDVSDPAAPVEVGYLDLAPLPRVHSSEAPKPSAAIEVSGSRVFLGGHYGGGVRIVDVSEPTTPVEVGAIPLYGLALDVGVAGDRAFVNESFDSLDPEGIHVFDVADPGWPVELDFFGVLEATVVGSDARMVLGNGLLFVIDDRFRVLEVSPAGELSEIGALGIEGLLSSFGLALGAPEPRIYAGVAVSGSRGSPFPRFLVLDVSDPMEPVLLGDTQPIVTREPRVEGDAVFVLGNSGVEVIDVSDPAAPMPDGWFSFSGPKFDMDVVGSRIYIAGRTSGLRILEVPEPDTTSTACIALLAVGLVGRWRARSRDPAVPRSPSQ